MSDLKMDMNNIIKKQEQVIDGLTTALKESLKLQSHYAELLNAYDGGQRLQFNTISEWLERLENGNKMEHQGEKSKMPTVQEGDSDR